METLALLITAVLLGGMTFFSFGFAPVLFAQLPMERVRPLLRGTFPYYYLVVCVLAALAAIIGYLIDVTAGSLLALVCLSTLYARQSLMPKINAASDQEDQRAFKRLHGLSVAIQIVQLGLAGWALVLIA